MLKTTPTDSSGRGTDSALLTARDSTALGMYSFSKHIKSRFLNSIEKTLLQVILVSQRSTVEVLDIIYLLFNHPIPKPIMLGRSFIISAGQSLKFC